MRINEIFHSIQGEGIYAGLPMTFIRLQFCPFNCSYCDTKYAQDKVSGKEMEAGDVLDKVEHEWTCVTGGEPLSQPRNFVKLVSCLRSYGHKTTVETSGLMPLPVFWRLTWFQSQFPGSEWQDSSPLNFFNSVDSWNVDVKCPSSRQALLSYLPNLTVLRPQDQVKFVVGETKDLIYADLVLAKYPSLPNVLISPVWGKGLGGRCKEKKAGQGGIVEACVDFVMRHEGVRLSLQLHKILWGARRGV